MLSDAIFLDPYFPFDYYIADRGDGGGYGTGTLNDPLNGSGTRFDTLMRDVIPSGARVRLGPGVFTTAKGQRVSH